MEPIDRVFIMKALTSSEGQAAIKAMTGPDAYAYFLALVCSAPAVDPIRAAGGCRCGECRHGRKSADALEFDGVTPLCECGYMTLPHRWYEHCSWGEPREAQEDG